MTLVVTGASGFIGAHVRRELDRRGVAATFIQRGRRDDGSANDAVPLDLSALPSDLPRALGNPDTLIHLAWGGLPNYTSNWHIDDELPRQLEFLRRLFDS